MGEQSVSKNVCELNLSSFVGREKFNEALAAGTGGIPGSNSCGSNLRESVRTG